MSLQSAVNTVVLTSSQTSQTCWAWWWCSWLNRHITMHMDPGLSSQPLPQIRAQSCSGKNQPNRPNTASDNSTELNYIKYTKTRGLGTGTPGFTHITIQCTGIPGSGPRSCPAMEKLTPGCRPPSFCSSLSVCLYPVNKALHMRAQVGMCVAETHQLSTAWSHCSF